MRQLRSEHSRFLQTTLIFLSTKESNLQTAEALVSMRAEGLDITSSSAVREWSARFLLTPIKDNSEYLRVLSEAENQSSQ